MLIFKCGSFNYNLNVVIEISYEVENIVDCFLEAVNSVVDMKVDVECCDGELVVTIEVTEPIKVVVDFLDEVENSVDIVDSFVEVNSVDIVDCFEEVNSVDIVDCFVEVNSVDNLDVE